MKRMGKYIRRKWDKVHQVVLKTDKEVRGFQHLPWDLPVLCSDYIKKYSTNTNILSADKHRFVGRLKLLH